MQQCYCLEYFPKVDVFTHQSKCSYCWTCPGCDKVLAKPQMAQHRSDCREMELCWCGSYFVRSQIGTHKETCSYAWKCPGCNSIVAKPQMTAHKSSCKAMELCYCGTHIVVDQICKAQGDLQLLLEMSWLQCHHGQATNVFTQKLMQGNGTMLVWVIHCPESNGRSPSNLRNLLEMSRVQQVCATAEESGALQYLQMRTSKSERFEMPPPKRICDTKTAAKISQMSTAGSTFTSESGQIRDCQCTYTTLVNIRQNKKQKCVCSFGK